MLQKWSSQFDWAVNFRGNKTVCINIAKIFSQCTWSINNNHDGKAEVLARSLLVLILLMLLAYSQKLDDETVIIV